MNKLVKPMVRIAALLKAKRIKKNLTLREVAARAEMSEGSLQKIERGNTDVRVSTLVRLLIALELKWKDL